MAAEPEVFNLVWHAGSSAARYELSKSQNPATSVHDNVIDARLNVPAVMLFPALLTPNLHVRGDNGGMIELLVAAAKSPELSPEHVNRCLKIARGLEAKATRARRRLFARPQGKIVVKQVQEIDGRLETHAVFKGVVHDSVAKWLPKVLDGYWAIQVHESCLDGVEDGASEVEEPETRDYQDILVHQELINLNGQALKGVGGCGTHEFGVGGGGIEYFSINHERAIVSYHPLFVYPARELREVALGHLCDIHLNARQKLLAHSPARIIDFESTSATDTNAAWKDSPAIGTLMNDFECAFSSVLEQMTAQGADVLLVTGDLIEHLHNAFPYHDGFDHRQVTSANAADIWSLVDLGSGYEERYHACVDLIAFFTRIRDFCTKSGKPVFVVSGNHDAYGANKIYGISPRIASLKANDGIPADHNLTFYEALLVFGESWGQVFGTLFDAKRFEWFYAMLTPFASFSLELPAARIVGFGWGDREEIISMPGSLGQGMVHLGRAADAATSSQLSLLWAGAGNHKKTVLMSHFTLVSHGGGRPLAEKADVGRIDVLGPGLFHPHEPFSAYDNGTFETNRAGVYSQVANPAHTSCVLTGHCHRKGLYFLGEWDGSGYATEGYDLRPARDLTSFPPRSERRVPIIVSDCAGPLPRYNLNGEFGGHGSDRPGGTIVKIGDDGRVSHVEAIRSTHATGKPRLAVAVDYMHVMKGYVFEHIEVASFDRAKADQGPHAVRIKFHRFFPDKLIEGLRIVLYGMWSGGCPWTRIALDAGVLEQGYMRYGVPKPRSGDFYAWLLYGSRAGRFMSFSFANAGGLEDIYEHETRWNLEVETTPSWWNGFHRSQQEYDIIPYANGTDRGSLADVGAWMITHESPNYAWRRAQFSTYRRQARW